MNLFQRRKRKVNKFQILYQKLSKFFIFVGVAAIVLPVILNLSIVTKAKENVGFKPAEKVKPVYMENNATSSATLNFSWFL